MILAHWLRKKSTKIESLFHHLTISTNLNLPYCGELIMTQTSYYYLFERTRFRSA